MRTTLVNGHFLAYLCLTLSLPVPRTEITPDAHGNFSSIQTTATSHIWHFMRHASPMVSSAQRACLARYDTLKGPIQDGLGHGSRYPWALLARLDAPKFFSDIIESLLGAIYIDSHGSISACEAFLSRLGLMKYLERAMEENVTVEHPKTELGMLAQEKVRYVVEKVEDEGEGVGTLSCGVWVGEREVVRVTEGISVMEVQTRGAEEAGRILKEERALTAEKEAPEAQDSVDGDGGVSVLDSEAGMHDSDHKIDDVNGSDEESMAYETASEMEGV